MAGMLPGVECARRRRLHKLTDYCPSMGAHGGSTRRSAFCLYNSIHDSHRTSSISSPRKFMLNEELNQDEKLEGLAKQAKMRLDLKFRSQRRSEGRAIVVPEDLQKQVFGTKKSGSRSGLKMFRWARLTMIWKGSEQDQEECVICLERFKNSQTLVHLPCAHRFHSDCLVPWLENNYHCPCCRMQILSH